MSADDPQDVPEVWRPHFRRAKIAFTFRELDRHVDGPTLNTTIRALTGIGTPGRGTVAAIAKALDMSVDEFNATRSKITGEQPTTPFTLPASADRLNRRERDAVLSIVHALLDARDRHDQPADTSHTNPAGHTNTPPPEALTNPEAYGLAASHGEKGVPNKPSEAEQPQVDPNEKNA